MGIGILLSLPQLDGVQEDGSTLGFGVPEWEASSSDQDEESKLKWHIVGYPSKGRVTTERPN